MPVKEPAPLITLAAAGINKPVTLIVPPTEILLLEVTPLVFAIVRLFNEETFEGITTPVEVPPKDKLEEEVVIKLVFAPAPVMEAPFNESVCAPTTN